MKNSTDKRDSKKKNNLRIKNGGDDKKQLESLIFTSLFKKQLESLIFTSISIGDPRSSNC